jgi:hypothetical protein
MSVWCFYQDLPLLGLSADKLFCFSSVVYLRLIQIFITILYRRVHAVRIAIIYGAVRWKETPQPLINPSKVESLESGSLLAEGAGFMVWAVSIKEVNMVGIRVSSVVLNRLVVAAALILLTAACSTTPKSTDGAEARPAEEKEAPLYYDFEDVLVPRDLKLNAKTSFVYQTSALTAGVLVFSSKVERNSLIQFFENNMAKDNWQAVSSFKSPRTLLLYEKDNRWCVINITDNQWDTLVEIWVAPYSERSGLLK